jgi:hypothetical protein
MTQRTIDTRLLTIGALKTEVILHIYLATPSDKGSHSTSQDQISITVSHGIHTPEQAGPYHPNLSPYTKWTRDSCDAIAADVLSQYMLYYDQAVKAGGTPSEAWLVD